MTQLDERYDALAWGSHLVPLMACVSATGRKPVLELGIGHFSTPVLHVICENLERKLFSIEDNKEWYEAFAKYDSGIHSVLNRDYDDLEFLWKESFGVVFIDNSPGGNRRKTDFVRAVSCSDYVVVHDFELDNKEAIQPLLDGGKIKYVVYDTYRPPTLIASMCRSLPRL